MKVCSPYHIGFTGTQHGMTQKQKESFYCLTNKFNGIFEIIIFHNGDCIGADAEAWEIALNNEWKGILHPPIKDHKRAFLENAIAIMPPLDYIARNKKIVEASKVLIATPKEFTEQLRSGTWSTIRYAKKRSNKIIIIWPDGVIEYV